MSPLLTVDPRSDPRWERLAAFAGASLFASPPWIRAISEPYDFAPAAIVLTDAEGRERAGLPFVDLDDGRGERRVAFPFSDYCDPITTNATDWSAIAGQLLGGPARMRLRVLLANEVCRDPSLCSSGTLQWHATEVLEDEDAQWARLSGSARRNIRRARRDEVSVGVSHDLAALRAFYDLHLGVRKRKYRLLPQPWRFFQALHDEFAPTGRLTVLSAEHRGATVAGVVLLEWGDRLYYKFNASQLGELAVRPNDLLAWATVDLARARGLRCVDWGVSDLDQPGLIRYKRKFATEESVVTALTSDGLDARPTEQQLTATLAELTRVLTDEDVPDAVTERASEPLYRYFA